MPQLAEDPADGPPDGQSGVSGEPDQRTAAHSDEQGDAGDEASGTARTPNQRNPGPADGAVENLPLDLSLPNEGKGGPGQQEEDEQQCAGVAGRRAEADIAVRRTSGEDADEGDGGDTGRPGGVPE